MLWGGRFDEQMSRATLEFSSSLKFDSRLFDEDLECTIAHVKMLNKIDIISAQELEQILSGIDKLKELWYSKQWIPNDGEHEDIHSAVEHKLTELIGDVAGKIHTGRSRNDQVVTDTVLWLRKAAKELIEFISELQLTLVDCAEKYSSELIPSFTHLQQAQPITFGYHLLTYVEMFERDKIHFKSVLKALENCPLGAGAVAGSTLPLDREYTAKALAFQKPTSHAMDTISNRDFLVDFLHYASVSMMHLSRLSEEIVLWSSAEFNWIKLSDKYTTGSSLMPQKRNPDMAELIRGKVGRVYGNYISVMTTMKALPLAYNRDMQEDKEPMFDSFDTLKSSLIIMQGMISTLEMVSSGKITSETILATDLADEFVRKGVPFRKSHEYVGEIVKLSEETMKTFEEIQKEGLKSDIPHFEKINIPNLNTSINNKKTIGSCHTNEVDILISNFRKIIY